jgi:hypothetical protein
MAEPDLALLRRLLAQRDNEIMRLRDANESLCKIVIEHRKLIIQAQYLMEMVVERSCDGDRRAVLQNKPEAAS